MEDPEETESFRHVGTDAHRSSQKPWKHAQGLHRLKPDGSLEQSPHP